jgi:HK97 family phage major capsid protein
VRFPPYSSERAERAERVSRAPATLRSVLLGKRWHEVSGMSGDSEDDHLLAYGDIASAMTIVDRIVVSLEIVQNLFGSNRLPTGQRGVLGYWRTSSAVIVPEAVRLLVEEVS